MHLNDKKTNINKVRTEIGMVFQQFNIYLHMTVAQNTKRAPVKVPGELIPGETAAAGRADAT